MGLSDSDLSGLGRQHFLTDSEMLRVYFVDLKPDLFPVNLQVTAAQSETASVEVQFNRNRRLSLSLNCKLSFIYSPAVFHPQVVCCVHALEGRVSRLYQVRKTTGLVFLFFGLTACLCLCLTLSQNSN